MHSVFISYRTETGLVLAKDVAKWLKDRYLIDAYVAHLESTIGSLDNKLKGAIDQSKRVVVLYTPTAGKSDYVRGEMEYAQLTDKEVIVCRHDDVEHTDLPINFIHRDTVVFTDRDELLSRLGEFDWGIPVVIPVAGKGSGLYPFSLGMPKTLFPVGEKPILHHILEKLDPTIFSGVSVVAGRFSKMIEYQLKLLEPGLPVQCIKTPGSTLPAALKNMGLKTTFLLHFGDIIIERDFNWRTFINHHISNRRMHGVLGTLMASRQHRLTVGRITGDDKDPQLIGGFAEKPTESSGYFINMAVALFEPEFLDLIEDTDVNIFGDTLTRALRPKEGEEKRESHRFAFYGHDEWVHIQTLNDWYTFQEHYFGQPGREEAPAGADPSEIVE